MKQSYHTDIAIQYKLGILDRSFAKQIPSSTLYNWRKKDFSLLVGAQFAYDFEQNLQMMKDFLSKKYLLNAAKALYFIYLSYVKIFKSTPRYRKILHHSKDQVISTINKVQPWIGLKKALRAFGISYQQYYAWQRNVQCKISPVHLCRKTYHNQLTIKEVTTIKEYLKNPNYLNWSLTPVYYQMLRDKAAFMSRSSFLKYAGLLKLTRAKPGRKKYTDSLRADAPKHILHMDVTIYRPLDNTRVYIYFLVDNFSRFILGYKSSLEYSAKITFQNIEEAYREYNLGKVSSTIDLVCDGGAENKGMVDDFVANTQSKIRKLVAQTDIFFSNSMVEAVNKRMKYDFLFTVKLMDFEQTSQYLSYAVDRYNHKPHTSLHGLTPSEVFHGAVPDKHMFTPAIEHAAQKRKAINLGEQCLNCLVPVG